MQSVANRVALKAIFAMMLFAPALRTAGEILHVPSQFPNIQSALNATEPWDTVFVEPGVYHEFLVDPDHPFSLAGHFPADTAEELRTILDPIAVAGPDTPSVFVLTGDTVSIRNFVFFNRSELREHGASTRSGALRNYAHLLHVENCRFDSVSSAIWGGSRVIVHGSKFVGCVGQCIIPFIGGVVETDDSEFESSAFALITAYSESQFVNSHFKCNSLQIHFLNLGGSGILIDRCKFGPCLAGSPVVSLNNAENVLIQDCEFVGLEGAQRIVEVVSICSNSIDAPVTVRRCEFRDYHPLPPAIGGTAITCSCSPGTEGLSVRIEDCIFVDGEIEGVFAPGIQTASDAEIFDCVFDSLLPLSAPDVYAIRPSQDSLLARDNSFLPPGLAAGSNGSYFDARLNWWGDSTGPFHASLNPGGLGSEVGNGVLFEPWLTQPPDSSDTTSAADDHSEHSIPTEFSLHVFPNPFNPVTTLKFSLPAYGNVTVRVHDVLGREVERAVLGLLAAGEHTLKLNGAKWSSGLHFATVSTNYYSSTAKLLLLK